MHSLTLLIPCSLIPSMVGNGVCLSDSCKPRKHQNSHFGGIATNIVGIALKQKEKFRINCTISTGLWSEWQDLNLRPLPPQAKGCSFLRDMASNTCFFVRKNWYKVRCVLLPPGSPVLKVVKYVVVKIRSHLMWSSIKGADNFLYGNCGQIMWSFSIGFRPPKVVVL